MRRSICILLIVAVTAAQKCRILALEGGGDRGAYEAG
jgi:hypothetical protein